MSDKHWAVFALRDIQNALDQDRYDVASCHIGDAIAAILARDEQDLDVPDRAAARDAKHGMRQTI
jgi:hypothetical protein